MTSDRKRIDAVRLLTHHGHACARNSATSIHQHPFWQIEYIRSGTAVFHADGHDSILTAGTVVMIPPQCPHGFRFNDTGADFFSIKYKCLTTLVPPLRLDPFPGVSGLLDALADLLPVGEQVAQQRYRLCEDLIRSLLCCLEPPDPASDGGLSGEIAQACARFLPNRPEVAGIAACLGLSRRGLHDRCRRLLGVSARTAIDAWLASQAQQKLCYGAQTQEAIAADLGFADAFSFARFFRRHHGGQSPGRWRQTARQRRVS